MDAYLITLMKNPLLLPQTHFGSGEAKISMVPAFKELSSFERRGERVRGSADRDETYKDVDTSENERMEHAMIVSFKGKASEQM